MAAPRNPHRRPKLTEDAVRVIRANRPAMSAKKAAERYGVHYRTIEKVRAYETWTHL